MGEIMNQNLEIITKIENDSKWFEKNYEKLRKTDVNKFIAVENEKIIAKSEKLEDIIEKVEKKGKNPALILIRYVYEKGFKFIL